MNKRAAARECYLYLSAIEVLRGAAKSHHQGMWRIMARWHFIVKGHLEAWGKCFGSTSKRRVRAYFNALGESDGEIAS